MKKSLIVAFIIAVLNLINVNTFAKELYSIYDFSADKITVEGNFDSKKEMVLFMILPSEENIEQITEQKIEENRYLTYQLRNESDGTFKVALQMPSDTSGGVYTVYAFCGGQKLQADFSYTNKQDVEAIVKDINKAGKTEISKLLTENSSVLGISDECVKYADTIALMIYERKSLSGYDTYAFIDELNRCSAIVLLKNSADVDAVMRSYGKSFGDNAQAEILEKSENHKKTFVDYIIKNETDKDTKQFFYRAVLISCISNAESYADLSGIINKYKEKAGLGADTDKLSVNAYKKLFDEDITDFSKLENIIRNLANSNNQSGGSTGSSGSSGGGGGVSMPSVSSGKENIIQNTKAEKYSDIKGHWCEEAIIHLSDRGIVSGYNDSTFKPDNAVTRAEFVKLIVSALNIETENTVQFDDVKETDWHFGYIGAGVKRGIVNGYGSSFRPGDMIKRQDAAVIIYRALGPERENISLSAYSDADKIADYAIEAIGVLSEIKILSGDGVNFMPEKGTTRAEAVSMIEKMLSYAEKGEVE